MLSMNYLEQKNIHEKREVTLPIVQVAIPDAKWFED